MRRFVLLLLIALLPLQSVHAAAGLGCVGGDAASGEHSAHPAQGGDHDHAAPAASVGDDGTDVAGGVAAGADDCSGAHGHCCLGLVVRGDDLPAPRCAGSYVAADGRAPPDVAPENPLRPPRATRA